MRIVNVDKFNNTERRVDLQWFQHLGVHRSLISPVLVVQLDDLAAQFLLSSLTVGHSITDQAGVNAAAGVTAELACLLHGLVEVESPVVLSSSIIAGHVGEPPSPRPHWILG